MNKLERPVVQITDFNSPDRLVRAFDSQFRCCVESLNPEPGDTGDVVRGCSELIPSDEILRETLLRAGLEDICYFIRAVTLELDVAISVGGLATANRHLGEPRLCVVTDRDD